MYTLSGIFFELQPIYTVRCSFSMLSVCVYLFVMHYILTFLNALLGGQKSRVAFAKITFKKPHIILLDEPSNHLVVLSNIVYYFLLVVYYHVLLQAKYSESIVFVVFVFFSSCLFLYLLI